MRNLTYIAEEISYIPAADSPLSADIGLMEGREYLWLFDVGNGQPHLELLQEQIAVVNKPCCAVLSHFHPDHIGNIGFILCDKIYAAKNTKRYLRGINLEKVIEVKETVRISDGIDFEIFAVPSAHAQGCLCLNVNGRYTWIGDAAYAAGKKGKIVYNANLLKEQIEVFSKNQTEYFLLSHREGLKIKKEEMLLQLKNIYNCRKKNEAYIIVED